MTDVPAASPERAARAQRLPVIRSVAILGAGTMGAQIAAHFANAGVPSLLLDLTPDLARQGLERARTLKPDPFFTPERAGLITTGGLDADAARLRDADWIIEAVVERLDVKRDLLARIDDVRRPGSIVSSNTSGIPIGVLAEGRSDEFRRHWLGTHFFNPPRYLRLLELIPTPETDPAIVSAVAAFADHRLGKGTVIAKDTPNFIANRVALYAVIRTLEALQSGRYTIEEIDAITGPPLGRPKSATFRTADIAGLDILAHVARTLYDRLPEGEREAFRAPPLLDDMLSRGWLGEKTGQGFYRREKNAGGESEILTLEPATMTYRARQSARLATLEAVRPIEDVRERARALFAGQDKVGRLSSRDAGADAHLHLACGATDRPHDRRRRSGDAVGVRLGAGAVRAVRRDRRAAGRRRLAQAADRRRRCAAAGEWGAGHGAQSVSRCADRAGGGRPADPATRAGTIEGGPQERRREPGGSRRRRAVRRVPLQDECHRRRHARDAAGGCRRGRAAASPRSSSETMRRTSRPAPT